MSNQEYLRMAAQAIARVDRARLDAEGEAHLDAALEELEKVAQATRRSGVVVAQEDDGAEIIADGGQQAPITRPEGEALEATASVDLTGAVVGTRPDWPDDEDVEVRVFEVPARDPQPALGVSAADSGVDLDVTVEFHDLDAAIAALAELRDGEE